MSMPQVPRVMARDSAISVADTMHSGRDSKCGKSGHFAAKCPAKSRTVIHQVDGNDNNCVTDLTDIGAITSVEATAVSPLSRARRWVQGRNIPSSSSIQVQPIEGDRPWMWFQNVV